MMNSVTAAWTWNTSCLQIFSCSTGTYVGGAGWEQSGRRSARPDGPRPEPSLCLWGVTGTIYSQFPYGAEISPGLDIWQQTETNSAAAKNFNVTPSKRVDGFWETIRPHSRADRCHSDVVSWRLVLKSRSWFTTGTPPHQIPLYALSRSQSVSRPLINLSEPV